MNINPLGLYQYNKNIGEFNIKSFRFNNLSGLKQDTVSFSAMKKTQFDGIDLFVINKFKVPIEKFKSHDDFQKWCSNKATEEYINKDFIGRKPETLIHRIYIMSEWIDFLDRNKLYDEAASLLILDGITSNLKEDNDAIPPILNEKVLEETISQIKSCTKGNNHYQADFNKLYQFNLRKYYIPELQNKTHPNNNLRGWIIISGKKRDNKNFFSNINKLKALSHDNWCTKSFNAKKTLFDGDFHLYMEKGCPLIGISFRDDEIQDIQGISNNYRISPEYIDIVKEHIKNIKLKDNAKKTLELSSVVNTNND